MAEKTALSFHDCGAETRMLQPMITDSASLIGTKGTAAGASSGSDHSEAQGQTAPHLHTGVA